MSRRLENHCVDCGLPCLGESCSYRNVSVDYCDRCGQEGTKYHIDGDDLCENCAEKRVREIFDDLSLFERAKAVDIELRKINN